jgi:putative nucleotidyltransferase with HDIG domain
MNHTSIIIVEQLNPGMIVAEDVYDNRGHMIISHELPVSERMIMRLKLYSIETVKIYVPLDRIDVTTHGVCTKRFGHIEGSIESQKFIEKYMVNLEEIKETIDEIVYGNEGVDQRILLQNIDDMIKESQSKSQLLYMIRNLKDYDNSIYIHSYNVAIICKIFGIWLNKSEADINVLTMCGLFHDIGKLDVLKEMASKESKDELEIMMECHPQRGYELLKNEMMDERIKLVALQHHERRNGRGYPNGLKIDEINEFAQIVAIADIYDKMTTQSSKSTNIPFQVFEYFQKEGFDLFDSKFLLPLMEKTGETYLHNKVTLTNGVEGEIIMMNRQEKSRPLVRTPYGFIDLSTERNLEIVDII